MATAISLMRAVRRQPIAPKAAAAARRYLRQAMSLAMAGMIFALCYVWTRVQVIQLGYEVSRIRKEVTELVQQRDLLEAEVASLKAPERLTSIASERFGMRLPRGDEVVIVEEAPATRGSAAASGAAGTTEAAEGTPQRTAE
jgi:cell division protein FtsL